MRLEHSPAKLFSQLELPPKETPLARILNGKTSDTTIHATGPHEYANLGHSQQLRDIAQRFSLLSDIDPDEDNTSPSSCTVGRPIVTKRANETGDDEMTHGHAYRASN